jgi:hypothetical protein
MGRAGGLPQAVKCLPSGHEALSSNPSATHTQKTHLRTEMGRFSSGVQRAHKEDQDLKNVPDQLTSSRNSTAGSPL